MSSVACPGVLCLQGASAPHLEAFARLGIEARSVRSAADLAGLTHLVLPGGESTTLQHLLALFGLWDELATRHRAGTLALFGTCAGAILLARSAARRPPTLGLLDAEVERNAYGSQRDSFAARIVVPDLARGFRALFIRAPRFARVGPGARVLARHGDEVVALEGPGLLATSFHPELSDDSWFHRRFLALPPATRVAG